MKGKVNTTYGETRQAPAWSGRLKDQLPGERPRERLIERGAAALSPAELIAILVRTGLHGTNALDIGKQLVQRFGSLGAMAKASVDEMQCIRGIGRDKAVTLVAAFTLGSKIAEELQRESPILDNPEAITVLLREQNRVKDVETFQILLLNTRRRLIRVEQVSQGTLDTILVHPRDGVPVAIEVQISSLSIETIMQRTTDYYRKGIYVLWLLQWTPKLDAKRYTPRLWEKWIHAAYFGRVYYWTDGLSILSYHFDPHLKSIPQKSWYSPNGKKITAGGYTRRSKRYRTPIRGRSFNLATDFGPRNRDWWEGKDIIIPAAKLYVDRQRDSVAAEFYES